MIEVKFFDEIDDTLLKFAVIISKTKGKWVFCKHKERDTYEAPGGHREVGEDILETAKRELQEETGIIGTNFEPIYTVVTEDTMRGPGSWAYRHWRYCSPAPRHGRHGSSVPAHAIPARDRNSNS